MLVSNREVLGLGAGVARGAHDLREARNAVSHLSPRADLGRREALTHLYCMSEFCRQMGYSTSRIDELWDAVDTGSRADRPETPDVMESGSASGEDPDITEVGVIPRAKEPRAEPGEAPATGGWPPPRDAYVIPDEDGEFDEFLSRQVKVRRWRGDVAVLSDPGQSLRVPERMTIVAVLPEVVKGLIVCGENDALDPAWNCVLVDGMQISRKGARPNNFARGKNGSAVRAKPKAASVEEIIPGSPCLPEASYDRALSEFLTGLCAGIPRDSWRNIAFLLPSPPVAHLPERVIARYVVRGNDEYWRCKAYSKDLEELKNFDRTGNQKLASLSDEEVEGLVLADMARIRTRADRGIAAKFRYVWCPMPSRSGGVCDFERIRVGAAAGRDSGEGGYSVLFDDAALALIRAGRTDLGIDASRWTGETLWESLQEMFWCRGVDRVGSDAVWGWFRPNAFPSIPGVKRGEMEWRGGIGKGPHVEEPATNGVPFEKDRRMDDYLREVFWRSVQEAASKGYVEFEAGGRKVPSAEIRTGEWEFPEDGVLVRPGCRAESQSSKNPE